MTKHIDQKQVTTPQSPLAGLKLRIEDHAFLTFQYFRDYRPDEVTMFGITKLDDPLYVTEFALVKQKVNAASSDCDPEGMVDHICLYMAKGIPPLNCERVWFHSHPMMGENSANPSAKDMSTWNDPDNKHKNFMIMGILSKSGHITCKLRVRGNLSSIVAGMNSDFCYELDIPIEIVKTDTYTNALVQKITALGGQALIESLGKDKILEAFSKSFSIKDLFPENIARLESDYSRLVTKDSPVHGGVYNVGGSHYGVFVPQVEKKTVTAATIPEVFAHVGIDISDIDQFLSRPYLSIASSEYVPCGDNEIRKAYGSYVDEWKPSDDDYVSTILGAVNADMVRFGEDGKCKLKFASNSTTLQEKKIAVRRSLELYPVFSSKLAKLCQPTTSSSI